MIGTHAATGVQQWMQHLYSRRPFRNVSTGRGNEEVTAYLGPHPDVQFGNIIGAREANHNGYADVLAAYDEVFPVTGSLTVNKSAQRTHMPGYAGEAPQRQRICQIFNEYEKCGYAQQEQNDCEFIERG